MAIKFEPYHNADSNEDLGINHRIKAKWHTARAGKLRNASIKAVGRHSYAEGLLNRGVGHLHPDHPEHTDHERGIVRDHDFAFNPSE